MTADGQEEMRLVRVFGTLITGVHSSHRQTCVKCEIHTRVCVESWENELEMVMSLIKSGHKQLELN